MYRYRDPNPEIRMESPAYMRDNLQKSLGGYVKYSLSEFPISALLNDRNNPFPLASAIALNYYTINDDERTNYYFQPYHTSVDCFTNATRFPGTTVNSGDFPPPSLTNTTEQLPYFDESAWDRFTNKFKIDPGDQFHTQYRECLNESYPCK